MEKNNIKPSGYWNNKLLCKAEAIKYNSRMDFKNGSMSAYNSSVRNKWLDEICLHMIKKTENWTIKRIKDEIKLYKSLSEIKILNSKLYGAIYRFNLSDYVIEIFGVVGNRFKKCIYSYEFSDNHVYVGLTYNIKERDKNRKKCQRDSVIKHINKTGLTPILKQLTDYIDVDIARIKEGEYVEKYKNEGWIILNIAKTGAIGGIVIKWTKSACILEAKKYDTKASYRIGSPSSYVTAKNKKWVDEICQHMIPLKIKDGTFTLEKCIEIGLKYKSLKLFIKENVSCYTIAKRKGWINQVIGHMIDDMRKPNNFYTKDYCQKIVSTCISKSELIKKHPKVYDKIRKNKWLDELCKNLVSQKHKKEFYNFDFCFQKALECKTKTIFHRKYPYIYNICLENNWIDKVCTHMIPYKKERQWTLEKILDFSKKYDNIFDFRTKSKKAYDAARIMGVLEIVCKNMKRRYYPNNYWTKEKCIDIIEKCNTISQIKLEYPKAYAALKRNKWLNELIPENYRQIKPNNYWNYNTCKDVSKTLKNRSEFKLKFSRAFVVSKKNHWLDEFFPKFNMKIK